MHSKYQTTNYKINSENGMCEFIEVSSWQQAFWGDQVVVITTEWHKTVIQVHLISLPTIADESLILIDFEKYISKYLFVRANVSLFCFILFRYFYWIIFDLIFLTLL